MALMSRSAGRLGAAVMVLLVVSWALLYIPRTPSFALVRLKLAVDARQGESAARFVGFRRLVRNAGYQLVRERARSGDVVTGLIGKGAVDMLVAPLAEAVRGWAVAEVNRGSKRLRIAGPALVGAIFFLHRDGSRAETSFRDARGHTWRIRLERRPADGQWQVVEVDDIAPLIGQLGAAS